MAKKKTSPPKENLKAIEGAWALLQAHPLFGGLTGLVSRRQTPEQPGPKDAYARICVVPSRSYRMVQGRRVMDPEQGYVIQHNAWRRIPSPEWANVYAQLLLHIAMNHTDAGRTDLPWRIACELIATDLLRSLSVGVRPAELSYCTLPLPGRHPAEIAESILHGGPDAVASYSGHGVAGTGQPSWLFIDNAPPLSPGLAKRNTDALSAGIRRNIMDAVEKAGAAAREPVRGGRNPNSLAERARSWFIANYPLLAALAAAFDIVEDEVICARLDIAVAAVCSEERQVYINPKFPWTYEGMQFVMAHELLHVGLRHEQRRQGRDPFLWNVACDYVINGWLVEMGVGAIPTDDLLLDPELGFERESAEAIYDRIVKDLRLMRRLAKARTMRGIGKTDMLGERPPGWWLGPGCDLDSFYRRALNEGLDLHLRSGGRGLMPADFVDEVRALQHPPIPWDVRLGQWLDAFFPPFERRRSFARLSRRQAVTPDIPRPIWMRPPELIASRTFGVVLDTSGSMSPRLLAYALGAIASYAISRDVAQVRVIQCDASPHDIGYVEPETLMGRVEVRGRGGTVLQPGIDKLRDADDFPKDAPILVITDGACDMLTIRREHAFLMPQGARLPFRTSAPHFHFESG
ncbi:MULTISPECIES: VWA-like domain-containing protein [Rhodomicrobium]|uniref:vWA domain-containing protein n=1 Tax=Rhodomicrobium TaxID=1068 RepID=UPI000B4A6B77|nr:MULTISPECIES: VWA-like domain-containing protein [Rhodomicrobium]